VEGKAKFIFPTTMVISVALMMAKVIIFINLDFKSYFSQGMRAFAAAEPVASIVAFLAVPVAR
jgi:Protein of unknown function (DUF2798)